MKVASLRFVVFFLLLGAQATTAFGQIWSEDFSGYPDGTEQDPPKWTTNATDCDDASRNLGPGASQWGAWAGQFAINDIEGAPCCNSGIDGGGNDNSWLTEVIDISGYCDISISMETSQAGNMECDSPGVPIFGCTGATPPDNSHDQIVAEYNLDGGGWVMFGYVCATNGLGTLSTAGLNGTNLQIRVFAANKSNSEYYYFDDVVVDGTAAGPATFTQIGPLCESDPPYGLPNVSTEGVTGTWDVGSAFNPNGLGGTTTTIVFTPDPGQCAVGTMMDITVDAETEPTPTPIGPYCETDAPVALETNIGGVTGNWTGAGVSGNMFDPGANTGLIFITFNPDPNQCALPTTLGIQVDEAMTPTLGTASLCQNDPPFDLTTIQDPVFPTGTWSGPGVAGTTFNPAGLNGPQVLTFTSDEACTMPATTTITVNQLETPVLGTATICQNSGSFDLTTIQDLSYPTGTWSGPGVTGTSFDPSGQNGTVNLTFTSDQSCVQAAMTTITVEVPGTPVLGTITLCQNQGVYDLTALQDPAFPTGVWTGTGVIGSPIFDPAGLVGDITLTFTPSGGCAFANTTTVTVDLPSNPNLGTATICETSGPFNLFPLQDPLFPIGNWSGPGVTGTTFMPNGMSGPIIVTFTPNGNCVNAANTTITVEEPGQPVLGTATMCQTDGIFNLATLNDPAFPAGTWSGPGVTGNNFDPTGQSGDVGLAFTPSDDCALPATTTVTVNEPTAPTLGVASSCESGDPIDLTLIEDPAFPMGTWSGPGVTGTTFDPSGQSGTVNITFTPSTDCSLPAQTTVEVSEAPTFSNLSDDCDPATQSYTITFDISGGTAPYTVNGDPVVGTTFTSTAIPSGTTYSFILDDLLECGPVTISGTVDCDCATDAGTMDFAGSPLNICHEIDDEIPVNFNDDEFLDGDDLLFFVLHDNAGTTLGTVYASVAAPANYLPNPGGLVIGQTYYISAIAGTDIGTGEIDLDDPCLSVAQGVPVQFYAPEMTITAQPSICSEDCADFVLEFAEGTIPYDLEYELFVNGVSQGQFGVIGIMDMTTLTFCPADYGLTDGTISIEITGFSDAIGCDAIDLPSQSVTVLPSANNTISQTLCPGESLVVNGTLYDEDTPTGQEVLPDGAANGCDSTIDVSLSFFPSDTNFIIQTLCTGSSLTVNGTVYDAGMPSGIEILPGANANNCDSIISVNLTFNSQVTFDLDPTLCSTDSVVVNGVTYNAGNPNGSQTFPMGSYLGCDSTVIISLSFFPPATSSLNPQLCAGGSITINGTVYDEDMPTGQEILPAASANGCDSIINVAVNFTTGIFANFTPTLCPGESVSINGTTYDEDMPNGQETFPMGSFQGCDSTVIIGLMFSPIDTFEIVQTLCTGSSMTVNGTVYDETMPSGIEVLPMGNVNGCDSVISVDLTFDSAVTFDLMDTLCPNESITVNGMVYDAATPTGQETFPMGSSLGCDSIVNISLSFIALDTFYLNQTLCTGGSLTVNGTVYDETTPSGIEFLPMASINGCDSVISVNLTFDSQVFGNLDTTLCNGESITVNGTVYDASSPVGTETYPMGSYLGCDSTVNIMLGFFPPAEFDLNQTICTGASIVVNGTVYNEGMPMGTEILMGAGQSGCDSIVNVNLSFSGEVFEDFDPELCAGESVTVNGTVYNEDNSFGEETFIGGSVFGCDSTVIIDLSFTDPVEFDLNQTLCTGGSVTVNGTVYDEASPSGVEILQNAAQNGCDSIVNVNLSFDSEVFSNFDSTLCAGEQIFINGTLYFSGNPTGSESYPGGSYLGCDSTVNISLSFYPEALWEIDTMLTFGETIVVNGTTYDQSNTSGVEVISGGSATGCDSTILVNLAFDGSFAVFASSISPTCLFGSDGSISLDSIVGGEPPYIVSLNGGLDTPVFLFPELFPDLIAGFYSITVRDANGAIVTENILLDNPPTPLLDLGADLFLDLGQSVTLSPTTDFVPTTYLWEPSDFLDCIDCDDPRSTPEEDITYTLTATTPDGCVVTDDISIFLQKSRLVYAPNAFSPNNDAINDEFTLFSGDQVAQINRLLIFDRWGALMFEQYNFEPNNLSIGWDGTYLGSPMNGGVYVWFAEVAFLDGQVELFEGGVTLVR